MRRKVSRRASLCRAALMAALWLLLLTVAAPASLASTFIVNDAGDAVDKSPGDGFCSTTSRSNGPCTLRAAIQETNARVTGAPHSITFNIPVNDARNIAVITPATALDSITRNGTTIDATTQPNTNTGVLGVGGTVGVTPLFLQTVNVPDVEIVGIGSIPVGLDIQASSVTIRGLAIYGFGNTVNSDTSANIRIGATFSGTVIEQNIVGSTATSFPSTYSGSARSQSDNIRSAGGINGRISNNLIGFSAGKGIQLGGGSTGWTVENNEVRFNGILNSNLDGIDIENGSGSNIVRGNLFAGNEADGIDSFSSSGNNTIINNTVTGNGIGTAPNVETAGIRIYGTGSTISLNLVYANYGAGIMV
ncbi:MAG TPA: right-handed parallel beta-helix repeat-containing protein, partial [Pyrinomonadaceae bacterium]